MSENSFLRYHLIKLKEGKSTLQPKMERLSSEIGKAAVETFQRKGQKSSFGYV